MIQPKPHIQELHRFPPDVESHRPYLRLDKNERVIPFPDEIVTRFHALLDTNAIMSYPEVEPLYQRLAAYSGVPRDHLFLASGSDLAIKTVFETYIAPGDKVLLHMPSYAMYEVYCKMFQANLNTVSFNGKLELNVAAFIDAISPQTRMVVLENPNGFTGTILSQDDIRAIAEKAYQSDAILLIDEVYFLFTGETVQSLYLEYDNVIIVRSFSKDFGMAGLRCGYLLSQPTNIAFLYRVKPMYEVTQAAVAFCTAILEFPEHTKQYVEEVKRGMSFLKEALHSKGLITGGGNGNFLLIQLGESCDIPAVIKGLKDRGVLVRRPFQVEAVKGWLRVGVGNVSQMEKFVSAFSEVLVETWGRRNG